ncbi:MAG: pilus assembly protein [Chloroflexi bacterium]|nr:pilus assembly protein [Chloroflexota bacterium]MBU1748791.1 pilus assembly protein [Chloroflexota bacterium]
MKVHRGRCWRRLHHAEEGQALIETILFVFPVCFLLVAGILFFGRAFYCLNALDAASFDGARMGIESLSRRQGTGQGRFAAEQTLVSWHMDPAGAEVLIAPVETWQRGQAVACEVRYPLYVGDIPFVGNFFEGQSLNLHSISYARVERYKSRWAP